MKKIYSTPEMVVMSFTIKDVILSSPTEGTIPGQGATIPSDIGGDELD